MAVLTTVTAFVVHDSASQARQVNRVYFSGAGVTITPIVAAASGQYHQIVGGLISVSKACGIDIESAADERASIEFAVSATAHFPVGFETAVGAALSITNADAATVLGYMDYVTYPVGKYIGPNQ